MGPGGQHRSDPPREFRVGVHLRLEGGPEFCRGPLVRRPGFDGLNRRAASLTTTKPLTHQIRHRLPHPGPHRGERSPSDLSDYLNDRLKHAPSP